MIEYQDGLGDIDRYHGYIWTNPGYIGQQVFGQALPGYVRNSGIWILPRCLIFFLLIFLFFYLLLFFLCLFIFFFFRFKIFLCYHWSSFFPYFVHHFSSNSCILGCRKGIQEPLHGIMYVSGFRGKRKKIIKPYPILFNF